MERIETIQDFKAFIKNNKERFLEKTIRIEDLPPDDEWINDTVWDDVYSKEVTHNGRV